MGMVAFEGVQSGFVDEDDWQCEQPLCSAIVSYWKFRRVGKEYLLMSSCDLPKHPTKPL